MYWLNLAFAGPVEVCRPDLTSLCTVVAISLRPGLDLGQFFYNCGQHVSMKDVHATNLIHALHLLHVGSGKRLHESGARAFRPVAKPVGGH